MIYSGRKVDNLDVKIFENREEMGSYAAAEAVEYLRYLGEIKEEINILFAAAPSQNDIYDSLIKNKEVPWEKINAMQLDDYINIDSDAPQRFANYLKEHIFNHVPLKQFYSIDCETTDASEEISRYTKILREHPVDVAFIGIGENGHIAFNDPGVADFEDPDLIKLMQLDETSRNQQVNDGCFNSIEEVPKFALTVTIPAILNARKIFCVVPNSSKANAVRNTLYKPITTNYPSSILREHRNSTLYIDKLAAEKI